jgi:hypothetical protein
MAIDEKSANMEEISQADSEFLQECRENYRNDRDRDQQDRQEAQDDHVFVYSSDSTVRNADGVGSQWSDVAWRQRKTFNRPIMQWNRMHIYQQYVVNQARQNDFAIRVSPSDKGTPETAEYFEGRIRQIEYDSNASTVYDIARENQCSSGRGFYRISTEFIPGTFNQRIKLDEIPDQFSVLFGPGKEYDRSDSERCWVILPPMSKAQYKRKFGKKALETATSFAGEDGMDLWWNIGRNGDQVQVCELFVKEFKKKKLLLLADGTTTIPADGLNVGDLPDATFFLDPEDGKPMERTEDTFEVWRYTIDGAQVLDKEQFAVDEIPIVPQWGLCAVVLGVQRAYSLGNRAKDAQRLVNLCVSNLAQAIGAQVKAKVMAEIEQIDKQHLDDWAGKTDAAVLFFSRFSQTLPGNPDLGVPQLIQQEAPIQALVVALNQAIEALKAAHGIYDASLGARGNETSGKAIDKRKEQAEIVNYHFLGNEARSRKRAGQILIKLISILDQPGMQVTVRDQAGKTKTVVVEGQLSDTDYGLNVDMGPTWKSQKDQVHQTDIELMRMLPPDMAMALAPEMLRTQDAPNAEERAEIAERVVNKLMPGILPPDEEEPDQIPPAVQQQMMGMQQELEKTKAFAESLHEQIQTEQVKRQTELQKQDKELAFKYRELEVKSHLELAKIGSAEDRLLLEKELGHAQAEADREHESAEAEASRAHQSGESEASRMAAAEQAEKGREHELTAAEMAAKRTE